MRKLTKQEVISKLEERNIDYILVGEYNGGKIKTDFLCPRHGLFQARPIDVLNGHGCAKCSERTLRVTEEEFIERARKVHNDFFTYKNCQFTKVDEKVTITCPIHGTFTQKANNHLNGQGCFKCKNEGIKHKITKEKRNTHSTKKSTTEEFIKRAKEIHGDKYDYSKVDYKGCREKVCIICPIHGEFFQTPNKHLQGQGCSKCSKNYHYNTREFLEKLTPQQMEDNTFNKTVYKKTHSSIVVTCKKHGDYFITPANFLKGKGCPICASSFLENEIRNFLIENDIEFEKEKHFKWLDRQTLDFYLPQFNVAIECQGIQHFKPIEFFGGEKELQKNLERDEHKKKLCEENNVKLLYYSNLGINYPYIVYEDKNVLLNKIKKIYD